MKQAQINKLLEEAFANTKHAVSVGPEILCYDRVLSEEEMVLLTEHMRSQHGPAIQLVTIWPPEKQLNMILTKWLSRGCLRWIC